MRTVYLVATTPDFEQVAVVKTAEGWRLPRWDRLKRIPPATDTGEPLPLAAHLIPTDIIHWSALPPRDTTDFDGDKYCLGVLAERNGGWRSGRHSDFVLMEQRHVLASGLLPARERLAVDLSLARARAPVATFDSREEVQAAVAWAEHRIADTIGARITAVARYRQERRDLVVRFETETEAVFLKAGRQRFADEAVLTQYVYALLPDLVPETIAADPLTCRWIYREISGVMMSTAPVRRETIIEAVRALVSLQQVTLASEQIACHVAPRRQTAIDLFRSVDSYVERAWSSVPPSDALASVAQTWKTLREAMLSACEAVDRLDVPLTLVPSDYWSQNILITPKGIGLIDLGNSFWSLPVLPLWRFVRDIKRRLQAEAPATRASVRNTIGSTFVEAWAEMIPPQIMTRAIGQLWLIGRLFGIQIAAYDMDLTEQSLGMDLPRGYRAAQLQGRIRELSYAFARQVVLPRHVEPELAAALDL